MPTSNTTRRTELIPLKTRSKARASPLTAAIQHNAGALASMTRQEKEIKGTLMRREKTKLSLFVDDTKCLGINLTKHV